MICTCGKPDCVQCLIQSSVTSYQAAPPPLDTMDAIVFVMKPIPSSDPRERARRDQHMNELYRVLQSLTCVAMSMNITPALNARYKSRPK